MQVTKEDTLVAVFLFPGDPLKPLLAYCGKKVVWRSLDKFAESQLASDRPINTLINNAGITAPRKRLVSQDGFELQFATNVLGHFLLPGCSCLLSSEQRLRAW